MRNFCECFNKLNEQSVRKCVVYTVNYILKNGGNRNLHKLVNILKEKCKWTATCYEVLGAYYSNEMFVRGRVQEDFDFDMVEFCSEEEQFNILSRIIKRYVDALLREHQISLNGERVKSTETFSSFPSVRMKEGEKVSFEETIMSRGDERTQMNEEMKEVFNLQMKRLNDRWYKAMNIILDDLMTGAFGSYISVNGEMKVSKAVLELAGEYVGLGSTRMREKFNDFISDVRRSYRG